MVSELKKTARQIPDGAHPLHSTKQLAQTWPPSPGKSAGLWRRSEAGGGQAIVDGEAALSFWEHTAQLHCCLEGGEDVAFTLLGEPVEGKGWFVDDSFRR